MQEFKLLSKKIYNIKKLKDYKRRLVFLSRVILNKKIMKDLLDFFCENKITKEILYQEPFFLEQATRQVFYKNSNIIERNILIKNHWSFILKELNYSALKAIYLYDGYILWKSVYEENNLELLIKFDAGQKKEGLMSVILKMKDRYIYQLIFWIDQHNGNSLYIGAIQGPNTNEANEIIKGLTKHCYGYRTKNLILFATRCVAKTLGIQKIYAVSNKGYYANNHIRLDRKLKTSLDDFWEEAGGKITADYRFYELPVEEYRKSIEEIKTHKRNLYRKRFELLDSIEEAIKENLLEVMNE